MRKVLNVMLLVTFLLIAFEFKAFAYCGCNNYDCCGYCDCYDCYDCYDRHDRYYYDDYPNVVNAYWDYTVAKWTVDGRASKYEIALYEDGYKIVTRTTYGNNFNFSYYMTRDHSDYWFEVRPYSEYSGWGNWVRSNKLYSNDRFYKDRNYRYPGNLNSHDIEYSKNQGPSVSNQANNQIKNNSISNTTNAYSGRSVTVPTPQIVYETNEIIPIGTLMQVNGECYFAYLNGIFAKNTWIKLKGKWYYFDTTGTMIRGFYTINGQTYYLNEDGSMATGMTKINGIEHYFDNNGIMKY